MKQNGFEKEYFTGRRDQFDLDLDTFWKCVETCKNKPKEELIETYRKEMSLVVQTLAKERASTLRSEIRETD
jgi:hypothetical protein